MRILEAWPSARGKVTAGSFVRIKESKGDAILYLVAGGGIAKASNAGGDNPAVVLLAEPGASHRNKLSSTNSQPWLRRSPPPDSSMGKLSPTIDNDREGIAMREKLFKAVLMLVALLVFPGLAWSQDAPQNLTLIVTGRPGQIPILQMNGKSYVNIDALARLTNSSLSFKGNQVILTPPGSAPSTPPVPPESSDAREHLMLVTTEGQPVDPQASDPPGQTKLVATGEKPADPESDEDRTAALAKAAQNPIANLISFPLQNNTAFGIGPYERAQNVLKIQPVIPFHISEKWNLITRTILPVVWQPNDQPTQGWFGFGDLNPSLFLSPAKPGKLDLGRRAGLRFSDSHRRATRSRKVQPGTVGRRAVDSRSLGTWRTDQQHLVGCWAARTGSGEPDAAAMVRQLQHEEGLVLHHLADWRAPSGNQAVVPFGGGMGRIMKIGFQPVNITGQFYGNAVHPAGASPWGMRLQIQFLFPKFTKEQEKMMMEEKLKQLEQEQQQAPQPKK